MRRAVDEVDDLDDLTQRYRRHSVSGFVTACAP